MLTALSLMLAVVAASASEAPFGSPDFQPSPERPMGFAADGGGWYPGATPVVEFWEGTPCKTTIRTYSKQKRKTVDKQVWDIADSGAKNILWQTRMPSWSNSQPIVVGNKVFTYSEPYSLVCCDATTGKILWTVTADPWTAAGAPAEKGALARQLHTVWQAVPSFGAMIGDSTVFA